MSKNGYGFFEQSNHTSTYTGTETAADVNPSNAFTVTLRASFISYAKSFSYTGSAQTWTVPYDGYYKFETWGASSASQGYVTSGKGGYSSGSLRINKNFQLYVYVGGQGTYKSATVGFIEGGYNGGGRAYVSRSNCTQSNSSGGGATDIRTVSGSWDTINSLRSRILVAGAGGGGEYITCNNTTDYTTRYGGVGGGINGGSSAIVGTQGTSWSNYAPTGATQTSGGQSVYYWTTPAYGTDFIGSFGYGFSVPDGGMPHSDNSSSSGGGSGWYGGAGGGWQPASGGSSYISGHAGSIAVTSSSNTTPKCSAGSTSIACSQSWTGYTFTNTLMIDGAGYKWTNIKGSLQQMPNPNGGYYASGVGHTGNGYARITYLGTVI